MTPGKRLFYSGRLRYEVGMLVNRYGGVKHRVTGEEPIDWLASWDAVPVDGDADTDVMVTRQLSEIPDAPA